MKARKMVLTLLEFAGLFVGLVVTVAYYSEKGEDALVAELLVHISCQFCDSSLDHSLQGHAIWDHHLQVADRGCRWCYFCSSVPGHVTTGHWRQGSNTGRGNGGTM
jgi:hypothetical protein